LHVFVYIRAYIGQFLRGIPPPADTGTDPGQTRCFICGGGTPGGGGAPGGG